MTVGRRPKSVFEVPGPGVADRVDEDTLAGVGVKDFGDRFHHLRPVRVLRLVRHVRTGPYVNRARVNREVRVDLDEVPLSWLETEVVGDLVGRDRCSRHEEELV